MQCSSAISDEADAAAAIDALIATIDSRLDRASVNLAVTFVAGRDPEETGVLLRRVAELFPSATTFGCSGEGTIGQRQEIERKASISVFAAELPGVDIHPFLLRRQELEVDADWIARLGVHVEDRPAVIILGEPFSFPGAEFLQTFNASYPGCPLIGGMASGGTEAGENRLMLNGATFDEGAVGVRVSGNIEVECVVSQGCRPVGRTFIVTSGEGNVIRSLAGRPAMKVIENMLPTLNSEDQRLMRFGIFVGRVIDEYRQSYGRGDFLIQSVIGADPSTEAIAVAGAVRTGTTVQFHVRDADSADEDLRELLGSCADEPPAGALLFSCNGRGTRMWAEAGHDIGVVQDVWAGTPTAGFFCAGEIGPIGGENFLHGLTASIGLLRPAR